MRLLTALVPNDKDTAKLSTDQFSERGAPEHTACFPWKPTSTLDFIVLRKIRKSISDSNRITVTLSTQIILIWLVDLRIILRTMTGVYSRKPPLWLWLLLGINDLAWLWLWLRLKSVGDNGVTRFGNASESDWNAFTVRLRFAAERRDQV